MSDLPISFDVARVRAAMLEGILVPREIVNSAFAELATQVKATRTHYFQKNGVVTDKRETADNGARLQAIDMVFSAAGIFKQDDRRSASQTPGVAIEVTKDGVIRIAVGHPMQELKPASTPVLDSVEEPTAISPGHAVAHVQVKDAPSIEDSVRTFNTILDEIVDE